MPNTAQRAATLAPTAKRLRKQNGTLPSSALVVVCPQCSERFSIAREVPSPDPALAERHAAWLQDQLVWDHIQENKHRGSVRLPAASEMK
jgi:hypothetical protein